MLTMPQDANIPSWAKDLGDVLEIDFPSRSVQGRHYQIVMDKQTRELRCNCPAARFGHRCSHLGFITSMVHKPMHSRKTGVQDTSMEAYGSIQKSLSDHQAIVCAYVDVNGPCSDREIAEGLHWPINDVTGRRNEDVKLGLLVFAGTKLDQVTNRTVMTWKAI